VADLDMWHLSLCYKVLGSSSRLFDWVQNGHNVRFDIRLLRVKSEAIRYCVSKSMDRHNRSESKVCQMSDKLENENSVRRDILSEVKISQ
jgi:hypothetical protein